MDFDNFCSFFECHSILAEKQRTKQTNYSSLSLSGSLDTQDTFQGGIIVEWKKFWQEIPVCLLVSNLWIPPILLTGKLMVRTHRRKFHNNASDKGHCQF